jgi:hypothetical protein
MLFILVIFPVGELFFLSDLLVGAALSHDDALNRAGTIISSKTALASEKLRSCTKTFVYLGMGIG